VPSADSPIHNNQLPQTTKFEGISIRSDVLFTNWKGAPNGRMQKRSEKALRKLLPALQRTLLPDETVYFVMRARSPLSVLEQLTAGWWTHMLAATAIVVTQKRILFFPVNNNGAWRESVRAAHWGDLDEVKPKGGLVRNIALKFKNGVSTSYTNVARADAKKLSAIASVLIPAAAGELSPNPTFHQLCPDCRNALTEGRYSCASCGLVFKDEKSMVKWSIFLPGGGYFYTGHPVIAMLPALVEGILILEIVLFLVVGLSSSKPGTAVLSNLTALFLFWAIETAVTILHCRRYVRDFIPMRGKTASAHSALAPESARFASTPKA